MCEKLTEMGCVQAKSLILKFPEWLTDPELQRHFIRGYYDGDGGIHIPKIKCRAVVVRIISTFEFCNSMRDIIMSQVNVCFGQPHNPANVKGKNVYTIDMSGARQAENFLTWLYKDATIWLDRKYNLYLELIEKNKKTQELIKAGTQGYSYRYLVDKNDIRIT
jgi:hypothetical protein